MWVAIYVVLQKNEEYTVSIVRATYSQKLTIDIEISTMKYNT